MAVKNHLIKNSKNLIRLFILNLITVSRWQRLSPDDWLIGLEFCIWFSVVLLSYWLREGERLSWPSPLIDNWSTVGRMIPASLDRRQSKLGLVIVASLLHCFGRTAAPRIFWMLIIINSTTERSSVRGTWQPPSTVYSTTESNDHLVYRQLSTRQLSYGQFNNRLLDNCQLLSIQ